MRSPHVVSFTGRSSLSKRFEREHLKLEVALTARDAARVAAVLDSAEVP